MVKQKNKISSLVLVKHKWLLSKSYEMKVSFKLFKNVNEIVVEQCKFYYHGVESATLGNDPNDPEFCSLLKCRWSGYMTRITTSIAIRIMDRQTDKVSYTADVN